MSILDDLATLTIDPAFDLPVNDETYVDPAPPAPVPERNYRLKIVDYELDKKQDGTMNTSKGGLPVINLKRVEVVEPQEFAGRVALSFTRVYANPYIRGGGTVPNASGLADLVRGHDQTINTTNTRELIEALDQQVQQGTTFRARIVWEGYDKDLFEQEMSSVGGLPTPDQKKLFYKNAKIKGMKNFPTIANGQHSGTTTGKSGATVEARATIGTVFPSGQESVAGL